MRKISGLIAVLTIGFVAASCGGGGTGPGDGGGGGGGGVGGGGGGLCAANTFCATAGNKWNPSTLTVAVGTTVTWKNDFSTDHNVTWNDAAGAAAAEAGDGTGNITGFSSTTHSRKFNSAGTFGFQCTLHPGMTGTLTVQ